EAEVHDAAVEGFVQERLEGFAPTLGRDDTDVVMREQFNDALPFHRIVLDDQKALMVRVNKGANPLERKLELLGCDRLYQIGKRAVGQAMLPLRLHRDD